MSSLKTHPLVGELTPEQRQALFDKLRQRKLKEARNPASEPQVATLTPHFPLSPAQQASPAANANRLLAITLVGTPELDRLNGALQQLLRHHTGLRVHNGTPFTPVTDCAALQFASLQNEAEFEHWQHALTRLQEGQHAIQAAALQRHQGEVTLLLATNPLLLDPFSQLAFAHQWLSLYNGTLQVGQLQPTDEQRQNQFARWSAQVLEHKFLNQEWNRLKPRSAVLTPAPTQSAVAPAHAALTLDSDFIAAHLPADESVKSWLLDAIHGSLSQAGSQQDVFYWLESPQLRAEAFESLLGFFPYYLPVVPQPGGMESQPALQRLQRLQDRFASVSEQLSVEVCQRGANAPMIHYHWFDLEENEDAVLQIADLQWLHPGTLLAPVDIHIVEQLQQVTINVHYQPGSVKPEQVNYLLTKLSERLQHQPDVSTATSTTLQDRLRHIWQELLQKTEIADDQSFFELGGHSLQVTELKFRIKQQLKLDIPISVLYELTTINKLANFILATHGSILGFSAAQPADEEEGSI